MEAPEEASKTNTEENLSETMGNILSTQNENSAEGETVSEKVELSNDVNEEVRVPSNVLNETTENTEDVESVAKQKPKEDDVEKFTKNLSAQDINLIIMGKSEEAKASQSSVETDDFWLQSSVQELPNVKVGSDEDFETIVKSLETAIGATESVDNETSKEIIESSVENTNDSNDEIDRCVSFVGKAEEIISVVKSAKDLIVSESFGNVTESVREIDSKCDRVDPIEQPSSSNESKITSQKLIASSEDTTKSEDFTLQLEDDDNNCPKTKEVTSSISEEVVTSSTPDLPTESITCSNIEETTVESSTEVVENQIICNQNIDDNPKDLEIIPETSQHIIEEKEVVNIDPELTIFSEEKTEVKDPENEEIIVETMEEEKVKEIESTTKITEPQETAASPPKKIKLIRDKPKIKLIETPPVIEETIVKPPTIEETIVIPPIVEELAVKLPESVIKQVEVEPSVAVSFKIEISEATENKSRQKLKLTRNYKVPKTVKQPQPVLKAEEKDQTKIDKTEEKTDIKNDFEMILETVSETKPISLEVKLENIPETITETIDVKNDNNVLIPETKVDNETIDESIRRKVENRIINEDETKLNIEVMEKKDDLETITKEVHCAVVDKIVPEAETSEQVENIQMEENKNIKILTENSQIEENKIIPEEPPVAVEEQSITVENKIVLKEEHVTVENKTVLEEKHATFENKIVLEEEHVIENKTVPEKQLIMVENKNLPDEPIVMVENKIIPEEQPVTVENKILPEEQPVRVENKIVSKEQHVPVKSEIIPQEQPVMVENKIVSKEQPVAVIDKIVPEEQPVKVENKIFPDEPVKEITNRAETKTTSVSVENVICTEDIKMDIQDVIEEPYKTSADNIVLEEEPKKPMITDEKTNIIDVKISVEKTVAEEKPKIVNEMIKEKNEIVFTAKANIENVQVVAKKESEEKIKNDIQILVDNKIVSKKPPVDVKIAESRISTENIIIPEKMPVEVKVVDKVSTKKAIILEKPPIEVKVADKEVSAENVIISEKKTIKVSNKITPKTIPKETEIPKVVPEEKPAKIQININVIEKLKKCQETTIVIPEIEKPLIESCPVPETSKIAQTVIVPEEPPVKIPKKRGRKKKVVPPPGTVPVIDTTPTVMVTRRGGMRSAGKPIETPPPKPVKRLSDTDKRTKKMRLQQTELVLIKESMKNPIELKRSEFHRVNEIITFDKSDSPKFDQSTNESLLKIVSVCSIAEDNPKGGPLTITKPLSVEVDLDQHYEEQKNVPKITIKQCSSPKIRIKPLIKPIEGAVQQKNSPSDNTPRVIIKPIKQDPLKITITKQSDDSHSILKIYKPEEHAHEETVPKLTIKPIHKLDEMQHSPRHSMKVKQLESIPNLTVKPIMSCEVIPTETHSPKAKKFLAEENYPKVTIKPIIKPDDPQKMQPLSPRQTLKIKAFESSGITMEPILTSPPLHSETQVSPLKISVKPFAKMEESLSPKLTIKPITKTCEIVQSEDGISNPLKLTIKPLKPDETYQSPKITIKPVVKPDEPMFQEEEKQERIILKIQKTNLPSPNERTSIHVKENKKESEIRIDPITDPTDKNEKLGKIKLKLMKEAGHAQIVPSQIHLEHSTLKRTLLSVGDPLPEKRPRQELGPEIIHTSDISINLVEPNQQTFPKSVTDEVTIVKIDQIEKPSTSMLSRALTTPQHPPENKLKEMLLQIQQKPEITCTRQIIQQDQSSDSDDVKFVGIIPAEKPKDPLTINDESNSQDVIIVSETINTNPFHDLQFIKTDVEKVVPVVPELVIPTPKKRGRPRKNPLEVKPEIKGEDCTIEIETRPKRTCRAPAGRSSYVVQERKPRGGGRGRGRGRGGVNRGGLSPKPIKVRNCLNHLFLFFLNTISKTKVIYKFYINIVKFI